MGEWSLLPLDDRDEVEKWFEAVGKEIRGVEGKSTPFIYFLRLS